MPAPIAAAAIAGGLNIGGQLIGNIGSRRRQKEAFKHNIDMWNMQNAYNTPKNQMARYKEAGLNPNLMYGQGSPGNATQLPKYQASEYKFQIPDMLGMLGMYQNTKTSAAQEQNITADTANKVTDNVIKTLETEIKEYDAQIAFTENAWKTGTTDKRTGLSKINTLNEEKLKAEHQKRLLIEQAVRQATTFNKYMDVSQIMGIAGKGGQLLNIILRAIMSGKKSK